MGKSGRRKLDLTSIWEINELYELADSKSIKKCIYYHYIGHY